MTFTYTIPGSSMKLPTLDADRLRQRAQNLIRELGDAALHKSRYLASGAKRQRLAPYVTPPLVVKLQNALAANDLRRVQALLGDVPSPAADVPAPRDETQMTRTINRALQAADLAAGTTMKYIGTRDYNSTMAFRGYETAGNVNVKVRWDQPDHGPLAVVVFQRNAAGSMDQRTLYVDPDTGSVSGSGGGKRRHSASRPARRGARLAQLVSDLNRLTR